MQGEQAGASAAAASFLQEWIPEHLLQNPPRSLLKCSFQGPTPAAWMRQVWECGLGTCIINKLPRRLGAPGTVAPASHSRRGGAGVGHPCHLRPCPRSPAASALSFPGAPLLHCLPSPALSSSFWRLGWGGVGTGTGPLSVWAVSSRPAGDAEQLPLRGAVSTLSFLCTFSFPLLSLLLFLTFWLLGFFQFCKLARTTVEPALKGQRGEGHTAPPAALTGW